MALNTYQSVKTAIQRWSHRNDLDDADGIVDDILDLVEAEMYHNDDQPLRVREMEERATATATAGSRYVALPDSFLDMRRLKLSTDGGESDLTYLTPESLQVESGTRQPRYFTITSQLEFEVAADSAYNLEMLYFKKETPLSSTNTTNDILTNYPNVYLLGGLWGAMVYASEDERANVAWDRFIGAIKGANKTNRRARMGPAPQMRAEGAVP